MKICISVFIADLENEGGKNLPVLTPGCSQQRGGGCWCRAAMALQHTYYRKRSSLRTGGTPWGSRSTSPSTACGTLGVSAG